MKQPKAIRAAQDQARKIISQARAQASRIKAQARAKAARIREQERTRRLVNRAKAQVITAQVQELTQKTVRVVRINTPNTLTLFNAVCGFISIIASIEGSYFTAAAFILAGVFFDWIDGKAARKLSEETPLGAQLDSLCDLVTFGVAPAVLVAMISPSFFSYAAGALFVLSAALRLGRFNVQQTKGVYFGVPTTTNGILLPCFVYLGLLPSLFAWYLLVMALLMNAPITIKKVF